MNIWKSIQTKFSNPHRGAKIVLTKEYNGTYAGAHGYILNVYKDRIAAKINIDGRMYHTYLRPNEFFLEFPELHPRLFVMQKAGMKHNRRGVNKMRIFPNWVWFFVFLFLLIILWDIVQAFDARALFQFLGSLILHK